ncbi:MAG: hypothetical protein IRZ03_15985 [Acidobacterium ailaaui]|nr:hypothetical protein [Pseudacidobacterium ailaaui]
MPFIRRNTPKKSNNNKKYFNEETEKMVLEYINCQDKRKKDEIFEKYIYSALLDLTENIINTYNLHYTDFETMREVQHDVIVNILSNLDKFDPSRGKAFTFFTIMTINYLIYKNKINYKSIKSRTSFGTEDVKKKIYEESLIEYFNQYNEEKYNNFKKFVEKIDKERYLIFNDKNDIRVLDAVICLYNNKDKIVVKNNKILTLYLQEISMQNRRRINYVINKIRNLYLNYINSLED